MTEPGFLAFGQKFSSRVAAWREELQDLEREGVTYEQWLLDDEDGGPGVYRVQFSPAEIHRYVRGLVGWDQYLEGGFGGVSDKDLAEEAQSSAAARQTYDENADGVCAADFLGEDVEALVCGWRLTKAQRVRADGPQDALALVHSVASAFPISVKSLTDRGGGRSSIEISSEADVQDLLFFVLRSVFEDAKREEWTPSAAGNAKRIDMAIPSARILIETKYVRDENHARRLADELRVDIESYHTHPSCGTLFALIWDPGQHIEDPKAVERDLTAPRTKGISTFEVIVRVI